MLLVSAEGFVFRWPQYGVRTICGGKRSRETGRKILRHSRPFRGKESRACPHCLSGGPAFDFDFLPESVLVGAPSFVAVCDAPSPLASAASPHAHATHSAPSEGDTARQRLCRRLAKSTSSLKTMRTTGHTRCIVSVGRSGLQDFCRIGSHTPAR